VTNRSRPFRSRRGHTKRTALWRDGLATREGNAAIPTDLAQHIQRTPLCDTHEHLKKEEEYVARGPDILQSLFANYVTADLIVAGATQPAVDRLVDGSDPDLRARFVRVQKAWQAVRHTGYGEAVRLIARELYDIEEITEVDEALLSEADAMALATRLMSENQYACFRVAEKKRAAVAAVQSAGAA